MEKKKKKVFKYIDNRKNKEKRKQKNKEIKKLRNKRSRELQND